MFCSEKAKKEVLALRGCCNQFTSFALDILTLEWLQVFVHVLTSISVFSLFKGEKGEPGISSNFSANVSEFTGS